MILSKLTTRPSFSIIGGWSTKLLLSKLYSLPSLLRKFGNCPGNASSPMSYTSEGETDGTFVMKPLWNEPDG